MRSWHLGTLTAGLFFLFAGAAFMLDELDIIRLRAAYLWPTLLILVGVSILLRALPTAPPTTTRAER